MLSSIPSRWVLIVSGVLFGILSIYYRRKAWHYNSRGLILRSISLDNEHLLPVTEFRQLLPRRPRPDRPQATFEELHDPPHNAMGFPCQDNPLVQEIGTRCKTISRNIGSLGCDKKLGELAVEKGRDISFIPGAYREARVADACPESCGLCEICAPGCALWFIGNGFCEPYCNNVDCQFDGGDCWDVDCDVSEWSEWGECSIICDSGGSDGVGGIETRTREIIVPKTLKGKVCPELEESRQGCNKGVPCPVACEVSSWSEWTNCSSSCGLGKSTRSRSIVKPPENGALECPDLTQSRDCLLTECDRSCGVSDWTEWYPCSNSCGPGSRTRTRSIKILPVGQSKCPELYMTESCLGTICAENVAEICKLIPWSEWTPCSIQCGGGRQARKRDYILSAEERESRLSELGASCPYIPLSEEQQCNVFKCSQDCVVSAWGDWSECDSTCGFGVAFQIRDILTIGSGAGVPCPTSLRREKECHNGPCKRDCVVSDWSEWSDCVTMSHCGFGLVSRSRSVTQEPQNGGQLCPDLMESKECHITCDLNCTIGSFTKWTECADECQIYGRLLASEVSSYRWPHVEIVSADCMDVNVLVERKSCGSFRCAEVSEDDCLVSEWSPWSLCSASCGGGSRHRSRSIVRAQSLGGKGCPNLQQDEQCGMGLCPRDCKMEVWSDWSPCSASCGVGTMIRSRNVVIQASSGGTSCGPLDEVAPCVGIEGVCPQRCEVSDWSDWDECSENCGSSGMATRTRKVEVPPIGEEKCPELIEFEDCDKGPCSQNCSYSDWSDWSVCSVECGSSEVGYQIRTRYITRNGSGQGKLCEEPLYEQRSCLNDVPCPVHCATTEWGLWSNCSASCGIGEMTRTRSVARQPEYGGLMCGPLMETTECFLKGCDVDCDVGEWNSWSECSAECNGGFRNRKRDVIQLPMNNGTSCPILVDYEDCNEFQCLEDLGRNPADCQVSEWSQWSKCPSDCGGAVHDRTRSIISPQKAGGAPCPELIQKRGCALGRCKGVPCADNVGLLEQNGVTCAILHAQGCDSNIKEIATARKMQYPDDLPPEARVKDACPMTCEACAECMPGCELRDKGNTICDEACNNIECEFDFGDCGRDCKIPLPLPSGLEIFPPATGLITGQSVLVRCASRSDRFSLASELSEAHLVCADGQIGSEPILELQPVSAFPKKHSSPMKSLSWLKCKTDACPYVGIENFKNDLTHLNGVYERGPSFDGRSHYVQDPRSPGLKATGQEAYHFWMDSEAPAYMTTQEALPNGSLTNLARPKEMFTWRLTSFDPYNRNLTVSRLMAATTSESCRLPPMGRPSNLTACLGQNSTWILNNVNSGASPSYLVSDISVRCITKSERTVWLKSSNTIASNSTMPTSGVYEGGRPVTFFQFPGGEERKFFCEDQSEVQKMAGMSCEDIVENLGCDFLLSDTGKPIPDFLPKETTLGLVCPESCHLCDEDCSVGCPNWFLGNLHCDPACNNEHCGFDRGDCTGQPPVYPRGERPFTFLDIDGESPRKMFCENQPEMFGLTDTSCEEIADSLGCTFRLNGTGKPLPKHLQSTVTVSDVCPASCQLCHDECSSRCPLWFLGNSHCDPACNNPSCQFDKGDCKDAPLNEALASSPPTPNDFGASHSRECLDYDELAPTEYSCSSLASYSSTKGCNITLLELNDSLERPIPLLSSLPQIVRVVDICPKTCSCCDCNDLVDIKAITRADKSTHADDGDCVDDPMVEALGYSCKILETIARKKFNGCEARLTQVASTRDETFSLPIGIPPITRVLDACPVTCQCCTCPRFKKPEPSEVEKYRIINTLKEGEIPNCIDDDRVKKVSNMTCREVVYALGGNCSVTFQDLSNNLPRDVPEGMTLAEACGYSCGRCPRCEDLALVEETAGYSCPQIVEKLDGNCDLFLKELGSLPPGVPELAQLKHACPLSCGACPSSTGEQLKSICQDHPQIAKLGYSCELLAQFSTQACAEKLADMGINMQRLPSDLSSRSSIKEACPATCGICAHQGHRCHDNPAVQKLNYTCATLIQVGQLGCQTFLSEIVPEKDSLTIPMSFKIKDVCEATCGLCGAPSCTDGYQNGNEDGIDCGGSCRPCRSCSPAPLKALGSAYLLSGNGVEHMSNRSITCALNAEKVAGPDVDFAYCLDGTFTKISLQCGETRISLIKGVLMLIEGQYLDHTALSSVASALRNALGIPILTELKISSAGDCGEMANIGDFFCQDNPEVEKMGFNCFILSKLGCDANLSEMSARQGVVLPQAIPAEAVVADVCPITCNSCDSLRKRLQVLKTRVGDGVASESVTNCLRVDFMMHSSDVVGLKAYLDSNIDKSSINPQLVLTLGAFLKMNNVRVRYFVGSEAVMQTAFEYLMDAPVKAQLEDFELVSIPVSEWTNGFSSTGSVSSARSVFIAPGLPPPLFDLSLALRTKDVHQMVGKMFRPIPGIGGASPSRLMESKGGALTEWNDASGSAAVISPVVETVATSCLPTSAIDSNSCCAARKKLEQFLAGPCGSLIYGRVVTDIELDAFCYERNQISHDINNDEEFVSCYEVALRISDEYQGKGGAACDLIPYLETLINSWCSRNAIELVTVSTEDDRRNASHFYCFQSVKSTLQQRFDLLSVAVMTDMEMANMCASNSCVRHHFRYVDALTQLQVGWSLSGASSFSSTTSSSVTSRKAENVTPQVKISSNEAASTVESRLLRDSGWMDNWHLHIDSSRKVVNRVFQSLLSASSGSLNSFFKSEKKRRLSKRVDRRSLEQSASTSFGLFVADYPEQFFDFVCTQVDNKFCQRTLLLLTEEDPVHNPTLIRDPCGTPCFIPMIGLLGGLVESFGERQINPYFKALGTILRSYARFYCIFSSSGRRCGDFLFTKLKSPKFKPHRPEGIRSSDALLECSCSRSFLNDGQCDPECFNQACAWDGDDCRVPVMFPEVYYALIDVFAESEGNSINNRSELKDQKDVRLSLNANTTCLMYDPSFSCTGKCRRLYEAGNNLQGCCFSASLEALRSILKVDMQHELLASQRRWVVDRSISYLEQSCSATFDRTCLGGKERKAIKLDISFDNVDLQAITGESTRSVTDFSDDEKSVAAQLVHLLRSKLSRELRLVESDIPSMILRSNWHGASAEVLIDAGTDMARIVSMLSSSDHLKRMTSSIRRYMWSIPLKKYSLNASIPISIDILAGTMRSRMLSTPEATLDRPAPLPFAGSFGSGAAIAHDLPQESCSAEFQWEIGLGYRVITNNASPVSTTHFSTRKIICSQGFRAVEGSEPDLIQCDNGRWVQQGHLRCKRNCPIDIWQAFNKKNVDLRKEAYVLVGNASEVDEGSFRQLACATGFTPARGRSPAKTTCIDGKWTRLVLDCRRQCPPYEPPEQSAYFVLKEKLNNDHGATRIIHCSPGYFPTPAISDQTEIRTECRDGAWLPLNVICIEPETVDPNAGPGLIGKMVKQLFSGAGMIGMITALLIAIITVAIVTFSWKLHFQQRADRNTVEHEQRMDHVAKLAAITQQTADSTSSNKKFSLGWSQESARSCEKNNVSPEPNADDYFGDVDLTPASRSKEKDNIQKDALAVSYSEMFRDAVDSLSVKMPSSTGKSVKSFEGINSAHPHVASDQTLDRSALKVAPGESSNKSQCSTRQIYSTKQSSGNRQKMNEVEF